MDKAQQGKDDSTQRQEGRKDVANWIKQGDITRPIYWGWNMEPGKRVIQIKLDSFLAKLKEWGLE